MLNTKLLRDATEAKVQERKKKSYFHTFNFDFSLFGLFRFVCFGNAGQKRISKNVQEISSRSEQSCITVKHCPSFTVSALPFLSLFFCLFPLAQVWKSAIGLFALWWRAVRLNSLRRAMHHKMHHKIKRKLQAGLLFVKNSEIVRWKRWLGTLAPTALTYQS